jgi:hypothetical protein
VTHAVDNDQATPVSVTQQVTITAPEFSIDAGLISSVYPPIGAVGAYGDDLPYVVVADPALPWERSVTPGQAPSPRVGAAAVAGAGGVRRRRGGAGAGDLEPGGHDHGRRAAHARPSDPEAGRASPSTTQSRPRSAPRSS